MAQLFCFRQLDTVSVRFHWVTHGSKGGSQVINETPYIGKGTVEPGQLDVGKVVTIILQNGNYRGFYVCGIRFCEASKQSPMILLSNVCGPPMYSFAVVLPHIEVACSGRLKRTYAQIDQHMSLNLPSEWCNEWRHNRCDIVSVRRFKLDIYADIDFPLGELHAQVAHGHASSSGSGSIGAPSAAQPAYIPVSATILNEFDEAAQAALLWWLRYIRTKPAEGIEEVDEAAQAAQAANPVLPQ